MEKWNKVDFSFLLNLYINWKCGIFITMKHRLFKYTLNVVLFPRNSIKWINILNSLNLNLLYHLQGKYFAKVTHGSWDLWQSPIFMDIISKLMKDDFCGLLILNSNWNAFMDSLLLIEVLKKLLSVRIWVMVQLNGPFWIHAIMVWIIT